MNSEPTGMNVDEIEEDITLKMNREDGLELDRIGSENVTVDSEANKEGNLGDEQIEEELADTEEEDAADIVTPAQASAIKRKLRIVVDDDDDD